MWIVLDSVVILPWPFNVSCVLFHSAVMLLSYFEGDVPRCPWRKRQEKRCKMLHDTMWTQLEADARRFLWISCLFQIGNGKTCAGGADYPTLQTCTSCQKAFTDGGPWKYEKKTSKAYQTFLHAIELIADSCGTWTCICQDDADESLADESSADMEDEIERMTEGTCRKQQKLQPIQSLKRSYILFFVKTETSRGKQTILNPNPVGHTGSAEIWKTSCKMEAQAPQMAQPHGHICNREAWIVQTETIDVAEYFIYFICMYFHHLFGRHWWPDASADHNSAWRFGPRPLWGQEPKGLAISSMQREKAEKAAYDWFDDDWYTYI